MRVITAVSVFCALVDAANAVSDCNNGNQCQDGQTCVADGAAGDAGLTGRLFGCSPFPDAILCPGNRYSCPAGTACSSSRWGHECVGLGNSAAVNATLNVDSHATQASQTQIGSQLAKAQGYGICATVLPYLPSSCTCTDDPGGYGGTIDCTEYIVLDTIGVRADLKPCAAGGAQMGVTVYDTAIGFTYYQGLYAGERIDFLDFPIPGLSIGVPGLGDFGVFAGVMFEGDFTDLVLKGTLDLCGEVIGIEQCGSDIYAGLPIILIQAPPLNFGDICGPLPAPTPPSPTPPPTPGPPCADYPPDGNNSTCAQQKGWGKCSEPWMAGFCCATCFDCAAASGCCTDTPPDTAPQYTCQEQHAWGKCGESWMQGHCCSTCSSARATAAA
jgi:hypothetical protein